MLRTNGDLAAEFEESGIVPTCSFTSFSENGTTIFSLISVAANKIVAKGTDAAYDPDVDR